MIIESKIAEERPRISIRQGRQNAKLLTSSGFAATSCHQCDSAVEEGDTVKAGDLVASCRAPPPRPKISRVVCRRVRTVRGAQAKKVAC